MLTKRILVVITSLILGWTLAMLSPAGSQPRDPIVSYKYYPVYGNTIQKIRQNMTQNTPIIYKGKKFDGLTNWYIKWRYFYKFSAKGCQIDRARVSVDSEVTFTMPQWQERDRSTPQVVVRWQNYYNALQLHENGHKEHGIKAASEILQVLRQFPDYPSCPELERAANAIANQIIARYNKADQEYDRLTAHGRTQGAIFP